MRRQNEKFPKLRAYLLAQGLRVSSATPRAGCLNQVHRKMQEQQGRQRRTLGWEILLVLNPFSRLHKMSRPYLFARAYGSSRRMALRILFSSWLRKLGEYLLRKAW